MGNVVTAVGRIPAPSWEAYGRRFIGSAWPGPTVSTVGSAVAEAVGEDVEEAPDTREEVADTLDTLLDELGPWPTFNWKVMIWPLLNVTEIGIVPSA